jgi:hypothetical protein
MSVEPNELTRQTFFVGETVSLDNHGLSWAIHYSNGFMDLVIDDFVVSPSDFTATVGMHTLTVTHPSFPGISDSLRVVVANSEESGCNCPNDNIHISAVNIVGTAYIELHNPTNTTISARGLYLTNCNENLLKWRMPAIIVGSGESVLVRTANNAVTPVLKGMQANFNVNVGEAIRLVDSSGNVLCLFQTA